MGWEYEMNGKIMGYDGKEWDRNGKCPEVYEVQSGSALFSKRG